MARLGDFAWWPGSWSNQNGASLTPIDGVLKNVRRSGNELELILDDNGAIFKAQISPQISEDFVIFLRHMLLQHLGETLSTVQDIDIMMGVLR